MELLYGRNDLQKYEKNTIQYPSPGRYTDELYLLGTRPNPETALSNTWTVDILQHTNTWYGSQDSSHATKGGYPEGNQRADGIRGSWTTGGRSLDDGSESWGFGKHIQGTGGILVAGH
jgi:hypothetical protein